MRPLFYTCNLSLKKKTDEGHLKQMREGLRNNFCFIWPNEVITLIVTNSSSNCVNYP